MVFVTHSMLRFILASASPRRKFLLEMAGFSFEVLPSHTDETLDEPMTPGEAAVHLAHKKAREIALHSEHAVVLGADTLVVLDGTILGKPVDETDAHSILRTLSGKTHEVITGVCLIRTGEKGQLVKEHRFAASTRVTFAALSDEEIETYVQTGSPMDKAGAYGIQDDRGALYISRIDGDYYNVVGLPLHQVYTRLKHFAPELLKNHADTRADTRLTDKTAG